MNNLDYEIRRVEQKDLPRVLEIENKCFVEPWPEESFLYEMSSNPFSNFWVITLNDEVVGFSVYWRTFESATICQIAIDPNYQHQGFASLLMQDIIDDCFAKRVITITLEVREHNSKAIGLYEKFKFKKELVKPNYYTNGDNAIYMVRKVDITL